MSIDDYNKGARDYLLKHGGMRAANERTRLKIALKEILLELGHTKEDADDAIQSVCVCDFTKLRDLFGLHTGD